MNQEQRIPAALHQGKGQSILNWFDPRGRALGMWAFALNRLTGIGLFAYLLLHLAVLSTLAAGEQNWQAFLNLARSPLFVFFDAILFAGLIYHALNGIRVALVGMGIGVRQHKPAFVVLMVLAALAFVVAMALVLTS